MKRITALIAAIIIVVSFASCAADEAQKISADIGNVAIYDTSALTKEEINKIKKFNDSRDKAVENSDVDALKKIKKEWDAFRKPIENYISIYNAAINNSFSENENKLLTASETKRAKQLEAKLKSAYKSRNEKKLKAAAKAYTTYTKNLKSVIETYNEIKEEQYSKAEISILPEKKQTELTTLNNQISSAFKKRNSKKLKELKIKWTAFVAKTDESLETAKTDLMNDWIKSANLTNSITNLLSFGTLKSTTEVSGHTITYTTQYNTNFGGSDDDIKSAMDSYLEATSSVFQAGVNYLKKYIDDISIRIEYKNPDGDVVSEKEFN